MYFVNDTPLAELETVLCSARVISPLDCSASLTHSSVNIACCSFCVTDSVTYAAIVYT